MKDLHATLDSVFTTVREKAPRVERHHDLMTLPDEILSYIIKIACEDARERSDWVFRRKETDRLVANLSLVSRRFRNAVVNTAFLWTCIDNRYCLAASFDERIVRSKGLPLTLLINFKKSDQGRLNILSRIMSIKDRCQRLRAVVDANTAKEVYAAEFSTVESLCLNFSSSCNRKDWRRVFKKWAFPNVTSLRIDDAVPPPGLFPNVTTCTLSYDPGLMGTGDFSYERLLQMLASIPQLRHLRVNFRGPDIPLPIDLVPVTLPSVSTITVGDDFILDISLSRAPPRLGRILASLILPNVKEIHLHVNFSRAHKLLAYVHSINPASETFREVTSLTIEDSYGLSHLTRNIMYPLFALFRNIRRLELKTHNIPKTLRDLEENLELNRLRTFVPRKLNSTDPVHIKRKDLDKLTRYPDVVRIA
ncbi:hypothetical protein ACEPAI_5582 [Sanghuangporus weigelae]